MIISTKAKRFTTAVATTAALLVSGCGAFNKEMRTEIEINSTPEKVWATLMDFEQFPN